MAAVTHPPNEGTRMRRGLTGAFDRLKRIAAACREDVRLGWRPGAFFLTYCRGWLWDRLFPSDIPVVR